MPLWISTVLDVTKLSTESIKDTLVYGLTTDIVVANTKQEAIEKQYASLLQAGSVEDINNLQSIECKPLQDLINYPVE